MMKALDPLAPGTLPRPGFIGRLARIGLGGVLLWGIYRLIVAHLAKPPGTTPPTPLYWLTILIAFYGWYLIAAQYLPKLRSRQALMIPLTITGLLLLMDGVVYNRLWAPPAAWFLFGFSSAVLGFIGLSAILAALFAVPG